MRPPRRWTRAVAFFVVALGGPDAVEAQSIFANTTPAKKGLHDSTANARAAVDSVKRLARRDGKRVLLNFGANWCVDCLVLDTLLADPRVAKIMKERFHMAYIDVGGYDRNLDILAEYGVQAARGVPQILVLSSTGTILERDGGVMAIARLFGTGDMTHLLERWSRDTRSPVVDRWSVALAEENDVTVDLSVERARDGQLAVVGKFTPSRPGFHLYGKDLPPEGIRGIGRPTTLVIEKTLTAVPAGPVTADRKTTMLHAKQLGLSFPVYPAGPVTLRAPLRLISQMGEVWVAVTYMSCSDQVCLAPVSKQMRVPIPATVRIRP